MIGVVSKTIERVVKSLTQNSRFPCLVDFFNVTLVNGLDLDLATMNLSVNGGFAFLTFRDFRLLFAVIWQFKPWAFALAECLMLAKYI